MLLVLLVVSVQRFFVVVGAVTQALTVTDMLIRSVTNHRCNHENDGNQKEIRDQMSPGGFLLRWHFGLGLLHLNDFFFFF